MLRTQMKIKVTVSIFTWKVVTEVALIAVLDSRIRVGDEIRCIIDRLTHTYIKYENYPTTLFLEIKNKIDFNLSDLNNLNRKKTMDITKSM